MSSEDIKITPMNLGAKKDKTDRRDYRISGITPPVSGIPEKFVLDDPLSAVKNQGRRPSCTAHAQTHHKQVQELLHLSPRFVMAKTKEIEGNVEEGAYTRNTFKVVNSVGACELKLCPEPDGTVEWVEYIDHLKLSAEMYDNAATHKSASYWRVNNSVDSLKETLFTHKVSVVMSMAWYREFNRPANGMLPVSFSDYIGGHAVNCVGWDDGKEAFVVKNSYSEAWGDGGYFYLPYSIFEKVVWDLWTSLDIEETLPVDDRYGEPRTWTSYMRERVVAFNPWLVAKIGRLPNNREIKALAYGYHDFETVFLGVNGDVWLRFTKPEARKRGLLP